jgi:formylglycine-generating enzyme required for sulfatase activity
MYPPPHLKTIDLNGVPLDMIEVPGGEFVMGYLPGRDGEDEYMDDAKPAHPVRLATFWLGRYPVTQAQWAVVTGTNPARFKGENRPVENVNWDDSQDYIRQLNALMRLTFRLPSEAEWEYAARGGPYQAPNALPLAKGASGQGHIYAGSNDLSEVGWYDANSHQETKPVGLKLPNALGLYDMSGNVWEWCQDWYDAKFYDSPAAQARNPQGPSTGPSRVNRGGSWYYYPLGARAASRNDYSPANENDNLGFRVAAVSL